MLLLMAHAELQGSNTTVWCEGEWADTLFADRVPCSEPLIRLFADIQPAGALNTTTSYNPPP